MSEYHTRQMSFKVGRINILISAIGQMDIQILDDARVQVLISPEAVTQEDIDCAEWQMDKLGKLLRGLGSEQDIEMFARVLNGPTLDEKLGRVPASPCGCKPK